MLHFLTGALVRQLEVVVDQHSLLVCTTRRESETNITGHSLVVTQAQGGRTDSDIFYLECKTDLNLPSQKSEGHLSAECMCAQGGRSHIGTGDPHGTMLRVDGWRFSR